MSFDRATGDLWIGDVGQSAWEEIDVQRAGAPGGTNFGWNRMEGRHCYQPSSGCDESRPDDAGHRVRPRPGLHRHRRRRRTAARTSRPSIGGYLFADYCSGRIWAIDPSTDAYRDPTVVADSGHSFAAFGEDEAGELYAVDIAGGALLRVTATRG